jgi:hypothetical protein
LNPLGKRSPFTHADDSLERSFQIDLAIGPTCTLGDRTPEQVSADTSAFDEAAVLIDPEVERLLGLSVFPKDQRSIKSWNWMANPNPVYGLAIEIENNTSSKYFLGSFLAAAIAGRWGILVVPDSPEIPRWIETLNRMMHKGVPSPIPSNVSVFTWRSLQEYLNQEVKQSMPNGY